MITIYQPPRVWGIPSMSPFCVKLETYLRMTSIEYKVGAGNPFQAPKGKIPYIKMDGKFLGDSNLIIEALKAKHGDTLDAHLTSEEKALSLVIQRTIEEHLYFAAAWLRWNSEDSWTHVRKVFLGLMPPIIKHLIIRKIKKNFLNNLYAQGMGRHSREEVIEFAKKDIKAISVLLGDRQFFFGDKPSTLDAIVYGFTIQILWVPWDSPLKQYVQTLPNITSYCERIKALYWKDL